MRVRVAAQSTRSRARALEVELPSGRMLRTPQFVPVGTTTVLKTVPPQWAPPGLTFLNTYHLLVQPGAEAVRALGGLHALFNCPDRPLITDSGGFQIFSLHRRNESGKARELKGAARRRFDALPPLRSRVTENGVVFRSYKDGHNIELTPETTIDAQHAFGADIILPLDELLANAVSERRLRESFERTHRWQARSFAQHAASGSGKQAMYGIVHGGADAELRAESARRVLEMNPDGLAIGGSLGANVLQMESIVEKLDPYLPSGLPRHLLGMGDPKTVRTLIRLGMDTFDSVFPTRAARHGSVFLLSEDRREASTTKITNARFRLQQEPLDPRCSCEACSRGMTAALLYHLAKTHDSACGTLLSIHNVSVMHELVRTAREDIVNGIL